MQKDLSTIGNAELAPTTQLLLLLLFIYCFVSCAFLLPNQWKLCESEITKLGVSGLLTSRPGIFPLLTFLVGNQQQLQESPKIDHYFPHVFTPWKLLLTMNEV